MKAEYLEPKNKPNPTTMFPNTQSSFLPRPPGFPAALMDCPNSEEDVDSRNSGGVSTPSQQKRRALRGPDIGSAAGGGSASGDGATIETSRRPRGRPPGSKNKPKPPVIITRDAEPPMSPYILEVPGGVDVVEALSRFSRRRNLGLCVLSGSGTVANVTLRQPSPTPGATVTFHGRFDILSISATFIPSSSGAANASPFASSSGGFTISLAGPQGQMIGGMVAGALLAAGTVYVVAASFNSPSYHRLSAEDEGGSSASGCDGESPPGTRSGEDDGGQHAPGMEMSVYNVSGHIPSGDVIWGPTAARQQQTPY